MSKFICRFLGVTLLVAGLNSITSAAAEESDRASLTALIHDFTGGVDRQNGTLLEKVFYPDGIVFGFAADAESIITLGTEQFAALHEEKRFGGQPRDVNIRELSVTDALLASASVDAFNDEVFYNYRITFIKLDSTWKILTATQRSRSN